MKLCVHPRKMFITLHTLLRDLRVDLTHQGIFNHVYKIYG